MFLYLKFYYFPQVLLFPTPVISTGFSSSFLFPAVLPPSPPFLLWANKKNLRYLRTVPYLPLSIFIAAFQTGQALAAAFQTGQAHAAANNDYYRAYRQNRQETFKGTAVSNANKKKSTTFFSLHTSHSKN